MDSEYRYFSLGEVILLVDSFIWIVIYNIYN